MKLPVFVRAGSCNFVDRYFPRTMHGSTKPHELDTKCFKEIDFYRQALTAKENCRQPDLLLRRHHISFYREEKSFAQHPSMSHHGMDLSRDGVSI